MNARGYRRYLDDLLRGRRPRGFEPDDFEAAQMRMAIDLQASKPDADAPRPEFLAGLQGRLAEQMGEQSQPPPTWFQANRRQVIVGTSAAATAAVAAVSIDRLVGAGSEPSDVAGELQPTDGTWQRVAASAEIPEGGMHPFDVGSVVGFVQRRGGQAEGISGVCTHQGCKLWFDAPDNRLRCPCHSTSFATDGEVLTHQLPIAPKPLPKLEVREVDGVVEVFAPKSVTEET